jgi:hypothetical protein
MIAPLFNAGKGLPGAANAPPADHGFVSEIIKLPYFGPAVAALTVNMSAVASGPVCSKSPDSSAPQPPGGFDRPGQLFPRSAFRFAYGSIPNDPGPA